MEVTFSNVTLTVDAESPVDAYDYLASRLAQDRFIEYTTDTFTTHGADGNNDSFRPTTELFPAFFIDPQWAELSGLVAAKLS
jgi:hypothetical protein